MPFQPGVAANPTGANGQPKRRWKQALERALIRVGEGDLDNGLAKVADRVIDAACDGDKDAWKEIAERTDGKVPQGIAHHGSEDEPPVRVEHFTRTIIDPQHTNP